MSETEQYEGYKVTIEQPIKTEPTAIVTELDPRKPEREKRTLQKKVLSVIESDPFQIQTQRRYMMLTEGEREDIKEGNPELNVRVADEEETMENLCIRDDAMSEDGEGEQQKTDNRELDYQERWKNYKEATNWIREMGYKSWILHNRELMWMPDGKILRWCWDMEAHENAIRTRGELGQQAEN